MRISRDDIHAGDNPRTPYDIEVGDEMPLGELVQLVERTVLLPFTAGGVTWILQPLQPRCIIVANEDGTAGWVDGDPDTVITPPRVLHCEKEDSTHPHTLFTDRSRRVTYQ